MLDVDDVQATMAFTRMIEETLRSKFQQLNFLAHTLAQHRQNLTTLITGNTVYAYNTVYCLICRYKRSKSVFFYGRNSHTWKHDRGTHTVCQCYRYWKMVWLIIISNVLNNNYAFKNVSYFTIYLIIDVKGIRPTKSTCLRWLWNLPMKFVCIDFQHTLNERI